MKTNELITLLSQDAPVRWPLSRALLLALAIGAIVSAILLLATIGMRKDMMHAIETARVAFKIILTLMVAVLSSNLLFKVGRPGASIRVSGWLLILPVLALSAAILWELSVLPEPSWKTSMMGNNAAFCLFFIPVLSIAPLAGFMIALRNGAPDNPTFAGAVAGLASAGIAAAIYAWHCPDDSPLFLASWYSLAAAVVTIIAALIGRKTLSW